MTCGTTHYAGCACHEARHAEELARVTKKFDFCDRDRVLAENERDDALAKLKIAQDKLEFINRTLPKHIADELRAAINRRYCDQHEPIKHITDEK